MTAPRTTTVYAVSSQRPRRRGPETETTLHRTWPAACRRADALEADGREVEVYALWFPRERWQQVTR